MDKPSEALMRKLRLIAEIKKGNYPNAESFAIKLQAREGEDGEPFGCSRRTIARDIQTLINVHKAPIEYDPYHRGYFLRDPEWEFQTPVLEEDFIGMMLIGTNLAKDLLPEPLKQQVENSVAQTLASNNAELLGNATLDGMFCASALECEVDPAIFQTVFDAWRQKMLLRIVCRNKEADSGIEIEPHILAFYRGAWYIKGYLAHTKTRCLYAVSRIVQATRIAYVFEMDRKLLEETHEKGLLGGEKIPQVKLQCDNSIADDICDRQMLRGAKIETQTDSSLLVLMNNVAKEELIPWILAQGGKVQLLEPEFLREEVLIAAQSLEAKHRKKSSRKANK